MSATPRVNADRPLRSFGLDGADRAHPVLARRLSASRLAELELVKTKRPGSAADHANNRSTTTIGLENQLGTCRHQYSYNTVVGTAGTSRVLTPAAEEVRSDCDG